MGSYKTEGVILKRTNFSEADRIVTAFTRQHGKIKILAKGTRRITSRRGPNIEVFNQVTLFLHKGRNFDILTEAQVKNTFPAMREDLKKISLAYYMCELIDGLCAQQQPHENVYNLLTAALEKLEETLPLSFEKHLLVELGFLSTRGLILNFNTTAYIEQLLERKLKTKNLLVRLA